MTKGSFMCTCKQWVKILKLGKSLPVNKILSFPHSLCLACSFKQNEEKMCTWKSLSGTPLASQPPRTKSLESASTGVEKTRLVGMGSRACQEYWEPVGTASAMLPACPVNTPITHTHFFLEQFSGLPFSSSSYLEAY